MNSDAATGRKNCCPSRRIIGGRTTGLLAAHTADPVPDGTRHSRMPIQPVHLSHKAFPGVVLGHMEKSEKDWRLPGALNKLRISGDIAQFVVILRKRRPSVGTTGRSSSPRYGASRCLASHGSEA